MFAILMLAAAVSTTTPRVPTTGSVSIVSFAETTHDAALKDARNGVAQPSCDLGTHTFYALLDERAPLNMAGEIRQKGATVGAKITLPRSRFTIKAQATTPFACDSTRHVVYIGDANYGVLSAYNTAGEELWAVDLPGFNAVESALHIRPDDREAWKNAVLVDIYSWGSMVEISGDVVGVSWRTGTEQFTAFFSVDGDLLGTIGPIYGPIIRGLGDGRFELATGESTKNRTHKFVVVVGGAQREAEP